MKEFNRQALVARMPAGSITSCLSKPYASFNICNSMVKCVMAEDGLHHFLEAQNAVYDQVISELSQGQKRSHWMWFIFPQIIGLGFSHMAQRFAIQSLEHARRYATHPELGQRLRQCTRLVIQVRGRAVSEIFGYPDDLKFHSSMTLFALAAADEPFFDQALVKYFKGIRDAKTIEILGMEKK